MTGATWSGGVAPGSGDRAIIAATDTVFIDGDITIGDGTTTTSVYAVDCSGLLVWRNAVGDASSSWTFTVNGHMRFGTAGRWVIGTEDSQFGGKSVGPIPSTRTANVYFAMAYYHYINMYGVDNVDPAIEIWGAENYHQAAAPSVSTQTVDSAADKVSFVDSARTEADNYWRGAWLEVTAGTNIGEKREITGSVQSTHTVSWSTNQPMPSPCDNTTQYSITHNYQRALLTTDAVAGVGATINIDRPADWQTGDYVALGVGVDADSTQAHEYVQITRVSASQYTATLSYTHKAGDMIFNTARNVQFNCNAGGTNNGYEFYSTLSCPDLYIKINWAFFNQCGYSGNGCFYFPSLAIRFPWIKNTTCRGYFVTTSNRFSGYFLYTTVSPKGVYSEYMIENLHGCAVGGLVSIGNGPSENLPLDQQEKIKLRELTQIGCALSTTSLVRITTSSVVPVCIYGVWFCGKPWGTTVATNRYGYTIYGGIPILDGFKIYFPTYAVYLLPSSTANNVAKSRICNGTVISANNYAIYIYSSYAGEILIQNVSFEKPGYNAIRINNTGGTFILLKNNKYNGCRDTGGTSTGALYIQGRGNSSYIFEADGEYGTTTPNNGGNVVVCWSSQDVGHSRYVSYNTKYVTPLNPCWAESIVPFGIDSGDVYDTRIQSVQPTQTFEAHNPTIDGSPSNSIALIHGGGTLENAEHPTVPRGNSNIKMKITPYAALGETKVNLTMPLVAYAAAGEQVTVSVYMRKNVLQPESDKPTLCLWGNGKYIASAMSDSVDTWEKVEISYIADYDGVFVSWITCANNLKYSKSSTTGSAEFGEPATFGTVIVYVDEFAYSVSS